MSTPDPSTREAKMTNEELDVAVAEKVFGLDLSVATEHTWRLDENGAIDIFALDSGSHNGPGCSRCDYAYCQHCHDGEKPHPPCQPTPPAYSTDISADYSVLVKVRETWSEKQQNAFGLAIERLWGKRDSAERDGMAVISDHMLYAPGDYSRAALAAIQSEGKTKQQNPGG